jgi:drug/metabolite transporter (DMT)-like permease
MGDAMGPATLAAIRWLFSALVMASLASMHRDRAPWRAPAPHLLRLVVLGAFGMGFCGYAAFEGSRTSPATNIALIYGCTSAFVAAWEIAAGRQRLKAALVLGIAACLTGVLLIITRGHPEVLRSMQFAAGDLWAAAGMLVFVGYTIVLRRTPAILPSTTQFVIMSSGATLALLPFAGFEIATATPSLAVWMLPWLGAAVFAAGIGAFLGYNISLKRNGPVLTSASLTLTPMYAAALAMLLIGEQLAWYHFAALMVVVAGLLLVNHGQRA